MGIASRGREGGGEDREGDCVGLDYLLKQDS